MTTLTISNEDFILLPLSLPDDAPKILHLHYEINNSDPLRKLVYKSPPPESEFISTGLPSLISRFSQPSSLSYKFVPASKPEKLVAYIFFNAPRMPDTKTPEEKERELRADISKSNSGLDKEFIFQLKTEEGKTNLKFLGEKYESRYWELGALVTDIEYQRRGLGTKLAEEGMKEVERRVREGKGPVEGVKVEGCYLVASPQGARTYEKAGFVRLGGREIKREGLTEEYIHLWFVKRFE